MSPVTPEQPSFSTEDMASLLFALTVGTQDAEGLRSLKEEIDDIAPNGLSSNLVQIELAMLKFSAVHIVLFRYDDLRRLHGRKLDEVQRLYMARLKQRVDPTGPGHEEIFLRLSEARLAAYNKAFDTWLKAGPSARERGEQTLTIGELFFSFCGVTDHNPARLCVVGHKFMRIVIAVNERLRNCRLT